MFNLEFIKTAFLAVLAIASGIAIKIYGDSKKEQGANENEIAHKTNDLIKADREIGLNGESVQIHGRIARLSSAVVRRRLLKFARNENDGNASEADSSDNS